MPQTPTTTPPDEVQVAHQSLADATAEVARIEESILSGGSATAADLVAAEHAREHAQVVVDRAGELRNQRRARERAEAQAAHAVRIRDDVSAEIASNAAMANIEKLREKAAQAVKALWAAAAEHEANVVRWHGLVESLPERAELGFVPGPYANGPKSVRLVGVGSLTAISPLEAVGAAVGPVVDQMAGGVPSDLRDASTTLAKAYERAKEINQTVPRAPVTAAQAVAAQERRRAQSQAQTKQGSLLSQYRAIESGSAASQLADLGWRSGPKPFPTTTEEFLVAHPGFDPEATEYYAPKAP